MKRFLYSCLVFFILTILSSVACATPIPNLASDGEENLPDGTAFDYYRNSGTLIGVLSGNEESSLIDPTTGTTTTLEGYITSYLSNSGVNVDNFTLSQASDVTLTVYGWNRTTSVLDSLGSSTSDGVIDGKVDDISGEYLSGTWEVTPSTKGISFYAVKAKTYFALYYVDPADSTGSWSTYEISKIHNNFEAGEGFAISHYTGFNSVDLIEPGPSIVPEPTTIIFLGIGLLGIAGIHRKNS